MRNNQFSRRHYGTCATPCAQASCVLDRTPKYAAAARAVPPSSKVNYNRSGEETEIVMNPVDLRALQAPLKDKYKVEPSAALVTLSARGEIGDGISCSVQTGQALVKAGLHPATGGTGTLACSGDMLLQALAACAGVTMSAVATAI